MAINDLLSKFSNLKIFQKSDQSVLGIDIGSSSIKVVQMKKKNGRAILETYGELALGPYAGLEIGRATHLGYEVIVGVLNDLIKESNISTKQCGIAIPLPSSMVSLIKVPFISDTQLAQTISIEARKFIPVPIGEVTLDWSIIPDDDDIGSIVPEMKEVASSDDSKQASANRSVHQRSKKATILIVAIHNEVIGKYQSIIEGTSLDSRFFEIEVFSSIRSIIGNEKDTTMIFDMGAGSTKLYIVEHGVVRETHTINRGSQDITIAIARSMNISVAEAETMKRNFGLSIKKSDSSVSQVVSSTLSYIFSEANRMMINYSQRHHKNIKTLLMTGGGTNMKGLFEVAKGSFQIEVQMADPFAKVDSPAFLDSMLKGIGPQFSVAIGVGLRCLQEMP